MNKKITMPKTRYVIVGPTASGKSALAMRLAKQLNGEIICADSRTVYKGLKLGTAMPSDKDRQEVVHHGLELVNPDEKFTAAEFQRQALNWIESIESRGKTVIIAGGTGLYIDGLVGGYKFGPPANQAVRTKLEKLSVEELQEKIISKKLELPENKLNKRHLVRVIEQGGVNREVGDPMQNVKWIGLDPGMSSLEGRIKLRARQSLENGLVTETAQLLTDWGHDAPAASGVAYRVVAEFLDGKIKESEILPKYILEERRYAKRQLTWFRRNKEVEWFGGQAEVVL
jgi:tRNA dimethylallyltransferase